MSVAKRIINQAIEAAVKDLPTVEKSPEQDPRWIEIEQLLNFASEALERAKLVEWAAHRSKMQAGKFYAEIKVRRELLAEKLGIDLESEDEADE